MQRSNTTPLSHFNDDPDIRNNYQHEDDDDDGDDDNQKHRRDTLPHLDTRFLAGLSLLASASGFQSSAVARASDRQASSSAPPSTPISATAKLPQRLTVSTTPKSASSSRQVQHQAQTPTALGIQPGLRSRSLPITNPTNSDESTRKVSSFFAWNRKRRTSSQTYSNVELGTPRSTNDDLLELDGMSHQRASSSIAYGGTNLNSLSRTNAGPSSNGHHDSQGKRRKDSISRKSISRILTGGSRRSSAGLTRLLGTVIVVLLLYILFFKGGGGRSERPDVLRTRWWEADSPDKDKLHQLLPKPSIITKPAKPKPPADVTHSFAQLSKLTTTFKPTSPPDWTGVVHITTATQYQLLPTLVRSLLFQTVQPNRIIVFVAKGLTPPISNFGPAVSIQTYSPNGPPVVALLQNLIPTLTTDHLLFVDGHLDSLDANYVSNLFRASGTKEYSSSILTAGGLILPVSLDASPTRCVLSGSSPSRQVDDELHKQRSSRIHVPASPFLAQTSWLSTSAVSNGIRTDVPVEVGISLALWTKMGIPTFALPIPVIHSTNEKGPRHSKTDDGSGSSSWTCERLKRSLQSVGTDRKIGPFFRLEAAGGANIRSSHNPAFTSSSRKAHGLPLDPSEAGKRFARDLGAIVLLLSGEDELDSSANLACGLAQENDIRVYVADLPAGKRTGGRRVLYDDSESGAHCHLDVKPLGSGDEGESVSLAVLDEMDKIGKVAVAIYLADGHRGREFDEVMKWNRGVFGKGKGGRRRSKQQMEDEKGTVIISLDKAEMQLADWIGSLPLDALRHWHTPRIDVSLVTNNRSASLHRLLSSLQNAHYFGDEVDIYLNLEQTADMPTQRLVTDFDWPYGTVTLRHRIIKGGLMPAIVESWYPASNDSYGVFLEDDIEVSPLYYGWLKMNILYYRYSIAMRGQSTRLFGISMFQQLFTELRPEGRQLFDAHILFESLALDPDLPYLCQIPCSWGAVYFPEIWREFHSYLALRLSEMAMPIADQIVPEIRSNMWPRSWKRYFIELIYMRGYVMLYPNYANTLSLSTNHLEKGTHIKGNEEISQKTKDLFNVPLMQREDSLLALPQGRLPSFDTLPIIDLWQMLATDEDIIERGWQTTAQLDSCQVPFRVDRPPTYNARELLCQKDYSRQTRWVATQPLAATLKQMNAEREKEAQKILKQREQAAKARIAAAIAKEDSDEPAGQTEAVLERPKIVLHPDSDSSTDGRDDSRSKDALRHPDEPEEADEHEQELASDRRKSGPAVVDDPNGADREHGVQEDMPDDSGDGEESYEDNVEYIDDTEPVEAVDDVPPGDERTAIENDAEEFEDDEGDQDEDDRRRRRDMTNDVEHEADGLRR